MRFFMILLFVATTAAEPSDFCETCIRVDGQCQNRTFLFDLPGNFRNHIIVKELGILRSENKLYYSFEPEINDTEYYKTGFINIDNPEEYGILNFSNGTKNFGTFAIDQLNQVIYLGGSDGIFSIYTKDKLAKYQYQMSPFSSRGDFIVSIFYRGNVYFVKESEHTIIQKKGNEFFNHLESLGIGAVKNFVIDKNYLTIFLNSTGLYVTNTDEIVKLSKNAFFRGLAIDLDSVVYTWWVDGIYRVQIGKTLAESKLVKIVDVPYIGAMTFDNSNNIMFTLDRGLYRLTKTSENTICVF